jgi:uncharacterized membrane protein YdbT with pleckstrin-like domain
VAVDDKTGIRLQDGEAVVLALRPTSWLATCTKVVTLGLYIPWWRVTWFVLTDRRLIAKIGILNKSERALPLYYVQDVSVHRTLFGVGRVEVSTAGGAYGSLQLVWLTAADSRRLADAIVAQAKRPTATSGPEPGGSDATTSDLVRLAELRDTGALSENEFAQQKARLLKSDA